MPSEPENVGSNPTGPAKNKTLPMQISRLPFANVAREWRAIFLYSALNFEHDLPPLEG